LQKHIQTKQKEINDLLNKERKLQDKFQIATSDCKFADSLGMIYKKTYKPLRVQCDDNGKSLKQAVTSNILITSIHGCCKRFFWGVGLKCLLANVHSRIYRYLLCIPRVVPESMFKIVSY
jgi:hypothetical protein